MNQTSRPEWRCIGASVQGATHGRLGLPNQDAIGWLPDSGSGPPLIVAIADGHGSPKHFRSDVGARLAVTTATTVVQQFLAAQTEPAHLSVLKRTAKEGLLRSLVRSWHEAVDGHRAITPWTEEEWAQLVAKEGGAARQAVEAQPVLAYGATLVAVAVTEAFLLYLQLGDGDILCVDAAGETVRPLPRDERLMANQTTSLCLPEAWTEVRIRFVPYAEQLPSLILLSTDGYANSFRSEEDFIKVGRDYLTMVRSQGIQLVASELPCILEEASRLGSGDDITLGILKRAEEADVDSINKRITALEAVFDDKPGRDEMQKLAQADAMARDELECRLSATIEAGSQHWKDFESEQQECSADLHSTLQGLVAMDKSLMHHVARLQRGVIASTILAMAGITLTLLLLHPFAHIVSSQPAVKPVTSFQQAVTLSIALSSGQSLDLTEGLRLNSKDIPGLDATDPGGAVAEISRSRNQPAALEVKNLSHQPWLATVPNGDQREVEPGKTIALEVGTKIDFGAGSVKGEIQRRI
jgi:serine/threonine protein phosphatase PrpC